MKQIIDQLRAAVDCGESEKYGIIRARVTTVFGEKTVTFNALIDIDQEASGTADGRLLVYVAGTYKHVEKTSFFVDNEEFNVIKVKCRWIPILTMEILEDGDFFYPWLYRATYDSFDPFQCNEKSSCGDAPAYVLPECYDFDEVVEMTIERWKAADALRKETKRYNAWLKSHMSDTDRKAYYAEVAAKAKATKAKNKAKKVDMFA